MEFAGKTAISTGAASGMGLLFAQNFASLGGDVVLCDVNEEVLNQKVAEINAKDGGRAIGVICDVRDYKQICNARDKAVENFKLWQERGWLVQDNAEMYYIYRSTNHSLGNTVVTVS